MLAWLWPSCGTSESGVALSSMFLRSGLTRLLMGCCVVEEVSEVVSVLTVQVGQVGGCYLVSPGGAAGGPDVGW
jgi:hypothetical protein